MTTTSNAPSAALLLEDARERAGMTQAQIAEHAGVARSIVCAYETGRDEPSLSTLAKLISATGHDLVVDLVPKGLPAGTRLAHIRTHRAGVLQLAAKHGLCNVRVFGSSARGEDTEKSDIDLLVDCDHGVSLLDIIGFELDLTDLLGVKVEVGPASA